MKRNLYMKSASKQRIELGIAGFIAGCFMATFCFFSQATELPTPVDLPTFLDSTTPGLGSDLALPSSFMVSKFDHVPVDVVTGELLYDTRPDIYVKSAGLELEVIRNYRSQREEESIFGFNWQWPHADRMDRLGDSEEQEDHIKLFSGGLELETWRIYEPEVHTFVYTNFYTNGPYLQVYWPKPGQYSANGWTNKVNIETPGPIAHAWNMCRGDDVRGPELDEPTAFDITVSGWEMMHGTEFEEGFPDDGFVILDSNVEIGTYAQYPFNHLYGVTTIFTVYGGGINDSILIKYPEIENNQGYQRWFKIPYTNNITWSQFFSLDAKFDTHSYGSGSSYETRCDSDIWVDHINKDVTFEQIIAFTNTFIYTNWYPTPNFMVPEDANYTVHEQSISVGGYSGDAIVLTYKDKSRVYFQHDGKLLGKLDNNGNKLIFQYDGDGHLQKMRDDFGGGAQWFTFHYTNSAPH